MDQKKIACPCSQKFNEEEFKKHFSSCQAFRSQFKVFDSRFGELLKLYSQPKEKLLIVKFLLKEYINVIDNKLRKYYLDLAQNPPSHVPINKDRNVTPPPGPSRLGNNSITCSMGSNRYDNPNQPNPYVNLNPSIQEVDNNGEMCQRCKVNPDVGYLECVHPICTNCFIKYAEQEFYNMKCNICQKEINDQTKKWF